MCWVVSNIQDILCLSMSSPHLLYAIEVCSMGYVHCPLDSIRVQSVRGTGKRPGEDQKSLYLYLHLPPCWTLNWQWLCSFPTKGAAFPDTVPSFVSSWLGMIITFCNCQSWVDSPSLMHFRNFSHIFINRSLFLH